jgi:ABC-type uncharacterized transport system ATPase subunit
MPEYVAYLALRHCSQRFDDAHLSLQTRRIINEPHNNLHHLGDGLFELAMLLAQELDLLIQQTPVTAILAYCHDRNEQS